jgi:hypothetical protein
MSSIEYDYDNKGNLIEMRFYDDYKKEKMIFRSKTKFTYRNEGKIVIRTAYDKKGKLIIRKRVAKCVTEYDTAKRLNYKEIRYFNKNDKLVNYKSDFPKERYAIVMNTYYPEENRIVRIRYNSRIKLVSRKDGYYSYKTEGRRMPYY